MLNNKKQFKKILLTLAVSQASLSFAASGEVKMDKRVKHVEHDSSVFSSDPIYPDKNYQYEEQLKIYGGKSENENPRPLLELGHAIYDVGEINESSFWLGEKNPVNHEFAVYGDWRFAAGHNDLDSETEQVVATTLNLELDWRLTGTERIHGKLTPFEERGRFTRFVTTDEDGVDDIEEFEGDFRFDSLFFEGDLGYLTTGVTGNYQSWDMPFSFGLMPLILQNGVWLDDAITGAAFTIPAKNSKMLDISNFDITVFGAFDKVSADLPVEEEDINLFGVTAFIEANSGYWELGYAFVDDASDLDLHDYHNMTISFTRRYGGWLSNSVRLIANVGQDEDAGQTADGFALLLENSLITSMPSTLVPYMNFFVGIDNPQSLARGTGAGGILKNTGIVFEGDTLTNFQSLDSNLNEVFGGALGVEYLFSLDQQLVVEVGATARLDSDATDTINDGNQFAVGARYQRNLGRAWLGRVDVIAASKSNDADSDLDQDIVSVKLELKRKF
jgi:hypothetical protein